MPDTNEVPRGYRDVGINADWNCSAYHLGPTAVANTHQGDFYIVDDRQDEFDPFTLVRRYYGTESDTIIDLAQSHDFGELVARYKREQSCSS